MDSAEKLLTIIIPTYNRALLLKKALSCLMPQAKVCSKLVDVYISDNNSTDSTVEVVQYFRQEYSNLIYHKQEKNIGASNNFLDANRRVSTKYVALLSDDDFVLPGYITTVIDILKKNPDVGLINVNVLSISENDKYIGTRDKFTVDSHMARYLTAGDFLKVHMIAPSLISSNVFLRQNFVAAMDNINKKEYPGYEWYYALMLSVIDKPCIYYDIPLLIQRQPNGENVRWINKAPLYFIYGFGHIFKSLDKLSPGLQAAWDDFFCKDATPPYLLKIVSKNRDFYKDKYILLKNYVPSRKYSIQLYLYIHYPNFVAINLIKVLKFIYRVIKRK